MSTSAGPAETGNIQVICKSYTIMVKINYKLFKLPMHYIIVNFVTLLFETKNKKSAYLPPKA